MGYEAALRALQKGFGPFSGSCSGQTRAKDCRLQHRLDRGLQTDSPQRPSLGNGREKLLCGISVQARLEPPFGAATTILTTLHACGQAADDRCLNNTHRA